MIPKTKATIKGYKKFKNKINDERGFSRGYMKEEFLRYCGWEYKNQYIKYTPIEQGEYRFTCFDFGMSHRYIFEQLNWIKFKYDPTTNNNLIKLIFNYNTNNTTKETTLTIDNRYLLEFSFIKL